MHATTSRRFKAGSYHGDLRQTIRALRRTPWYTLTVVGVIALAMAMAVAAFRLGDGVLFKPLPFERADEIYQVSGGYSPEVVAAAGQKLGQSSGLLISARDVADLTAAVPTARFTMVGGGSEGGTLGDLRTWSPSVVRVDANFFDVIGMSPLIGGFVGDDFETASELPQPAMVSYSVWQRRLSGRADALGQILTSETASGTQVRYRVAGILPRGFLYPTGLQQPDLLAALVLTDLQRTQRTQRRFQAYVRLSPEVPLTEIQARFDAVGTAGRAEIPDRTLNGGLGYWDRWALRPLATVLGATQRSTFWSVFVAAGVLLLLACLNISGLIAARTMDRARELALRQALGARSRDIGRLVLLECLALIAAGSAIGVVGSSWLVALALRLLPSNLALLKDPGIDWRVVAFVLTAVSLSTMVVSLWPLRRSLQLSAGSMGASVTPRLAGRSIVIAGQVALALVLTVGGTLVVGSLIKIWQTDVGFSANDLLVAEGTATSGASASRMSALHELLDRAKRIPGVIAVGATQASLLRGGSPGGTFTADTYGVSSGFFETLAQPLIAGRYPTTEELASSNAVAVASQSFASEHFPDGSAVGRSITTPNGKETFTIVGVVENARYASWNSTGFGGRQFYRALGDASRFSLVLRIGPGGHQALADLLHLASAIPELRLTRAAMAEELLQETVRPQRFRSWLFGSFSVAALVIAGIGILGLVASMAAKRTREAGIRIALGSTSAGVVRLLLREQLTAVGIGLVAGGTISYWAVGFVKSYLYETTPYDVRLWIISVLTIVLVAMVGVIVPATRLGRIDPVQALRTE